MDILQIKSDIVVNSWLRQKSHTHTNGFVNAGFTVYINMADSLAVSQNRNSFGCCLNISDQLRWASWYDQVDQLVQSAKVLNFFSCAHLQKGDFAHENLH